MNKILSVMSDIRQRSSGSYDNFSTFGKQTQGNHSNGSKSIFKRIVKVGVIGLILVAISWYSISWIKFSSRSEETLDTGRELLQTQRSIYFTDAALEKDVFFYLREPDNWRSMMEHCVNVEQTSYHQGGGRPGDERSTWDVTFNYKDLYEEFVMSLAVIVSPENRVIVYVYDWEVEGKKYLKGVITYQFISGIKDSSDGWTLRQHTNLQIDTVIFLPVAALDTENVKAMEHIKTNF
ncbi:unnamed protein product [Owenia fusiformis]|uniref:Uncharacterized protein n=1 Tax=Owenia fusiformis TaxID=6347 RepID=A0A8S4PQ06_OWEFU|nr:unnamed protein product [Owenia fusiformis]